MLFRQSRSSYGNTVRVGCSTPSYRFCQPSMSCLDPFAHCRSDIGVYISLFSARKAWVSMCLPARSCAKAQYLDPVRIPAVATPWSHSYFYTLHLVQERSAVHGCYPSRLGTWAQLDASLKTSKRSAQLAVNTGLAFWTLLSSSSERKPLYPSLPTHNIPNLVCAYEPPCRPSWLPRSISSTEHHPGMPRLLTKRHILLTSNSAHNKRGVAFNWGSTKVRGVNLGGWLVLES